MRVLVNAVSIKEGGAVTVLSKLIPAMLAERPDLECIAAINSKVDVALAADCRVTWQRIPSDRSPAHLLWWYERGLPAALEQSKADVLFSMTNYLPRRRIDRPSLLLVQHAGHFSPEFERLQRSPSPVGRFLWRRKTAWVHRSIASADAVTVQTAALADAIAAATGKPRADIRIVPHGPGWVEHVAHDRQRQPTRPWRIGYVSTWSAHKNFPTLLAAARRLASDGRDFRLVVTLNPADRRAAACLAAADALGLAGVIENRGQVSGGRLADVYDGLDIFAFPSVCESFGMPMVEAMARGLPIVAAAIPEVEEVTGGTALTFSPYDAAALADQLERLMSDPSLLRNRSAESTRRGREFTWQKAARGTIAALEAAAAAAAARPDPGQ